MYTPPQVKMTENGMEKSAFFILRALWKNRSRFKPVFDEIANLRRSAVHSITDASRNLYKATHQKDVRGLFERMKGLFGKGRSLEEAAAQLREASTRGIAAGGMRLARLDRLHRGYAKRLVKDLAGRLAWSIPADAAGYFAYDQFFRGGKGTDSKINAIGRIKDMITGDYETRYDN